MAKMTPADLAPLLSTARNTAIASLSDSKVMSERSDAMDYYNGIMTKDMPAQEGRSRAVSTDVADVIDGVKPQLVEIFLGGDQVVSFNPVGPEDEDAAQQETDYVNHVFMYQNNGYLVGINFIHDGLLQKVGFVKVRWEDGEREQRETYQNLTDAQFMMVTQAVLQSDGGMKIVEHTEKDAPDY